jgi:hypothetical protein
LLLQGVLSKLGAAKELMKEVLAREKKKQEERAAAKEKDVYVSLLGSGPVMSSAD